MQPRARREDREVLLFSRVLTLDKQETGSGDTEGIRFFVDHRVLCRRSAAEKDLDSHDGQPFARRRVFIGCYATRRPGILALENCPHLVTGTQLSRDRKGVIQSPGGGRGVWVETGAQRDLARLRWSGRAPQKDDHCQDER